MFGPRRAYSQLSILSKRATILTSQQRDPSNIPTQLDVVRDEVALQRRARAQRWMPQLLKVDERLVTFDQLRPAHRLSERARRFREAEQAVELGEHPDRAQPQATVRVELGVEPVLELFDRCVAVLARLLEFTDSSLERGNDVALCVLQKRLV